MYVLLLDETIPRAYTIASIHSLIQFQQHKVEARSNALVYPHYTEVVSVKGQSYWSKSSAMWKMSQKHLVLLQLLPTTLRGFVPQMHEASCRLAEGLRLLDGQVHSRNRAKELCLDPRSRAGS